VNYQFSFYSNFYNYIFLINEWILNLVFIQILIIIFFCKLCVVIDILSFYIILICHVRPIKVWLAISALKFRAALLCLGLGLTQLIKPFQVALTLTLHSCRRFNSRHSPFPLTERSARVCPKVHFELAQTQFLLHVSSPSSLYDFFLGIVPVRTSY